VTSAGEPMAAAPAGRQRTRPGSRRAERSERTERPGDAGGASLVALALTAFLLLAGLLAVDVGALAAARAGAQTAADLAALAALTPGGDAGASNAAAIASANGAELVGCDCSAVEAVVRVRRRVTLVPTGLSVWVTTRARAVLAVGPSPPRATSARGVRGAWPGRSGSTGAARVA
jgi:secretion/DNA translocation related TadE-like protein